MQTIIGRQFHTKTLSFLVHICCYDKSYEIALYTQQLASNMLFTQPVLTHATPTQLHNVDDAL